MFQNYRKCLKIFTEKKKIFLDFFFWWTVTKVLGHLLHIRHYEQNKIKVNVSSCFTYLKNKPIK